MRTPIFVFTILVPTAALAGGNLIPTSSPRDLALGQAAVADQTGAEAVFLNTAALAGQDGFNVSAAGEAATNRTDWSDPSLGSASIVPQTGTPPAVAVAFGDRLPNNMAWGVGAGFGVAGGGSIIWPNGWAGQESIQSVRQQVFQIGVGAALQPLPYLKIGASFVRYQESEELHQSLNYLDHFGDAGIGLSGGGSTFGVAAEFRVPTVPLALAVTYKHSADLNLTGDIHFTAVPPAFESMIHDQGVSEQFTMPDELYAGAAYEVIPDLKVMAAYSFERWSVYKTDTFVGTEGFMAVVPRNYNNANVVRFGGEYQRLPFLPALTARVGIVRSLSSQPSDTVSPSLTDGDSWSLSIGAGYAVMDNLRVDLGYSHAFFDTVTASGDAFPGSYKTQIDFVSLGVNWRMK